MWRIPQDFFLLLKWFCFVEMLQARYGKSSPSPSQVSPILAAMPFYHAHKHKLQITFGFPPVLTHIILFVPCFPQCTSPVPISLPGSHTDFRGHAPLVSSNLCTRMFSTSSSHGWALSVSNSQVFCNMFDSLHLSYIS